MSASMHLQQLTYTHSGASGATIGPVDLDLGAGEMVSVIGPSGSGKTTLLRMAAGLLDPDRGDVLLDGRSVLGDPPERRDLTMMFHRPHLFGHLDVLDNIAFASRVAGRSRTSSRHDARRYLALVQMDELAGRRPRQLSGGQQQRVALARALAARPGAMLLDEPFGSLDAELRAAMQDLLGEVRKALAPTVLMVTHDVDEAALADRVAVLVAGRIVQVADVATLYSRPAGVDVARLLGGFTEVPGSVGGGIHHSRLGQVRLDGCAVDVSGPGTLLLRRDQVTVRPVRDPAGALVTGTVLRCTRAGVRQVAHVEMDPHRGDGPLVVEAELPPGTAVTPGSCVEVVPPSVGGWVV